MRTPKIQQTDEWLSVESLDLEAQGVAHNLGGKVVFIEDALPGEEVQVNVNRRPALPSISPAELAGIRALLGTVLGLDH